MREHLDLFPCPPFLLDLYPPDPPLDDPDADNEPDEEEEDDEDEDEEEEEGEEGTWWVARPS